ncbi:hypothetical protein PQX77_016774 [Marasmius sp. AFHP31]|nr:hypothetical protein PQX77_016774 [Marasmius sp. AFHP31]
MSAVPLHWKLWEIQEYCCKQAVLHRWKDSNNPRLPSSDYLIPHLEQKPNQDDSPSNPTNAMAAMNNDDE